MTEIGVRELKARASEIVRTLRETSARYTVTHRGRAVAVLLPIGDVSPEDLTPGDPWDDLVGLGAEMSAGWSAEQDSAEILSEMRR